MKPSYRFIVALAIVCAFVAACAAPTPIPPTTAPPSPAAPQPTTASQAATAPAANLANLKGKVTVWYDSGAAWNPAITKWNEEFKKIAPNVEVEWNTQDPAQISSKLVAAFSAGSGPDIVMSSQDRMTTAENQLQAWADLSPFVQKDKEFADTIAALPKEQVDSYKNGTKLWGLPAYVQRAALFVRKSWLDAAGGKLPTDWQEMTDLAKKMTKSGQFGYCMFGAPGVTNSAGIQYGYLAAAAGIQYPVIDPNGKPTFNTPEAVQVAKWMYNWQHVDKITPPATPTFTHVEFYAAVQAGSCGMGRVGAWNVGSWESSQLGKDYTVITLPPMTKTQKGPNFQVTWSGGVVMQAKPKDTDATFAYFKYLTSKQGQTVFFPVTTSWARTDLDFATLMGANERLLYFATPQKYVTEMAYNPNWLPILDILSKRLNGMLADSKSNPEQIMTTAYDEAMAKYKELGGK